jgi:hypothetical protein
MIFTPFSLAWLGRKLRSWLDCGARLRRKALRRLHRRRLRGLVFRGRPEVEGLEPIEAPNQLLAVSVPPGPLDPEIVAAPPAVEVIYGYFGPESSAAGAAAPASLSDFAEAPADPSLVDLVLYLPPATEDSTSADAPPTPRWDLLASDWPFSAPPNSKETPAAPPLTPHAPCAPPPVPQAPLGGGSRGGGSASSNGGGGGAAGGVGGGSASNGVNQALFHAFQAGLGFSQPAISLPTAATGGSPVASSTISGPQSRTSLPPATQTNPSPNSVSPTLPNTPGANDCTAGSTPTPTATTTTSTTALGTSSPQMAAMQFASSDPSANLPTVQFSASTYSANEGQGAVAITVTLSAASSQTVTVQYGTSNGSGLAGTDYVATSGTLTFNPGTISQTFNVPVLDDNLAGETSPETVNLTLSSPSGATLGSQSTSVLSIAEDADPAPTVEFSAPGYSANEGQGSVPITVTLSAASVQTVTVNYATSNGSALAGTDYVATSGVLTFAPGVTMQTFNLQVLDDNLAGESSPETVNLTLSNPSNATLGTQYASVLDVNEDSDGTPTVQFQSSSFDASDGQGSVPIIVTLSAPSSQSVSVDYATSDGTAVAGTDHTATSGVLTFAPNTTSQTIEVQVLDDNQAGETSPETVNLTLSNPSNATLGTQDTTVLDINEDSDYSLQWQNGPQLTWTQTPPSPPVVTDPGTQNDAEGDNVSLQIAATDPGGYALSYAAVDLPPGLAINGSTGVISGTIAYDAAEEFGGVYQPTVIVADSQGASSTQQFTWNVSDTVRPPTITNPGNQTDLRGDNVSLQIQASQPDGDQLVYDASNLPPGLTIDPNSGLISGTVDPTASALNTPCDVTVTARDIDTTQNVTASTSFNWTIAADNQVPTLTNPGNAVNAAGDSVDLLLSAADPDGDPLTYTASGLPAGLSIDPSTGEITGVLPNSAASANPYAVSVSASDGVATSTQQFQWTVAAVGIADPGDQSDVAGDSVSLQMTGTDADNQALTWSASGLPAGLSINPSSGLISGTLPSSAASANPYAVTVSAADGSSNASSVSFRWSVAALSLAQPADQDNREGSAVSLQLQATDVGGTPTFSATGTWGEGTRAPGW